MEIKNTLIESFADLCTRVEKWVWGWIIVVYLQLLGSKFVSIVEIIVADEAVLCGRIVMVGC